MSEETKKKIGRPIGSKNNAVKLAKLVHKVTKKNVVPVTKAVETITMEQHNQQLKTEREVGMHYWKEARDAHMAIDVLLKAVNPEYLISCLSELTKLRMENSNRKAMENQNKKLEVVS